MAAEGDAPPPKPPGPPPPRGDHGEHRPGSDAKDKGKGPFGMFHGGPGGDFDKLSEAERTRVREAMNQAWSKPEMEAARDKFMKASQEFREVLRQTLQGIDPEVVKILEKVKPPMPWEMRSSPPALRPEDPEFVQHAVARLGFEMQAFGKPDQREALRHLHDRVVELPVIKALVDKLQAAPIGERMAMFKTLRDAYKQEVEREISDFRKKREKEGKPVGTPKV